MNWKPKFLEKIEYTTNLLAHKQHGKFIVVSNLTFMNSQIDWKSSEVKTANLKFVKFSFFSHATDFSCINQTFMVFNFCQYDCCFSSSTCGKRKNISKLKNPHNFLRFQYFLTYEYFDWISSFDSTYTDVQLLIGSSFHDVIYHA